MKKTSKVLLTSGVIAAALLSGGVASADRGGDERGFGGRGEGRGQHMGWVRPGNEMKFADSRDAETGIEMQSNGNAVIRGAKVSSISGPLLTVTETLGAAVLTVTVNTDAATQFNSKNGKTITITDITIGDIVTVRGALQSGTSLSLKATMIRDISKAITPAVVNTQQVFEGTLSAAPGASLPASFTMTIGSTPQVVTISPTTSLFNKDWAPVAIATFQVGDVVRVFGYIPAGTTTVTGLVLRNATR
jgi:Domain of unknown function (DUF5666)